MDIHITKDDLRQGPKITALEKVIDNQGWF